MRATLRGSAAFKIEQFGSPVWRAAATLEYDDLGLRVLPSRSSTRTWWASSWNELSAVEYISISVVMQARGRADEAGAEEVRFTALTRGLSGLLDETHTGDVPIRRVGTALGWAWRRLPLVPTE